MGRGSRFSPLCIMVSVLGLTGTGESKELVNYIPAALVSVSLVIQCFNVLSLFLLRIKRTDNQQVTPETARRLRQRQPPGYAYDASQLAGCTILVAISFICASREWEGGWRKYTMMSAGYLYCTALAFFRSLYGSFTHLARFYRNPQAHLTLAILSQFSVYAYRDLYPLATYMKTPLDYALEGSLLYVHVAILLVVGIIIPLCRPRYHLRPLQPENEDDKREEIESLPSVLSLVTYTFLDPVILAGYRAPHCALSQDEFPALNHGDRAQVLKKSVRAEKRKDEHIFFLLVRSWWRDLLQLASLLIAQAGVSYVAPLGIERVLSHLEKGPRKDAFQPWFWIAALLVGPVVASIALQWYTYVATRMVTQIEAALTQLIYERALKMQRGATGSSGADDDTPKQSLNINSILTTDLFNIREARDFLTLAVYIPLHVGLAIVFLYRVLGWSAFVGFAVILALLPLPGYFASKIRDVEIVRMGKTDGRVGQVTEALNVLRMIKLFGWEGSIASKVEKQREEELKWVMKRRVFDLCKGLTNFLIPIVTMVATYATYTLIMHQPLSASKVFSSMAVFDILRGQFHLTFHTLAQVVTGKVSLDRLGAFLNETELLDRFSLDNDVSDPPSEEHTTQNNGPVKLARGRFVWSQSDTASSAPAISESSPSSTTATILELPVAGSAFVLNIDEDIQFERGSFTLVVGPTGSGKTALLMAVLGEMHRLDQDGEGLQESGFHISFAYAAQESWVLNDTIRNNILFGAPYSATRYVEVLRQTGLERDLTLFAAGDQTEVGERGLTLSGGQKARVTLARAVYSDKEVLLLDDVLAALDVHTSQWVVEKCFAGELMKGRTVVLVTHNVPMARKVTTHVVKIGQGGLILGHGPIDKVLPPSEGIPDGEPLLVAADEAAEKDTGNAAAASSVVAISEQTAESGKLVAEEEVEVGHVNWNAMRLFFSGLGGQHYLLFFLTFGGGIIGNEFLQSVQTWYLGYWASQYDTRSPEDVNVIRYLSTYGGILTLSMLIYATAYVTYIYGSLRASRTIHRKLIRSILGTTLRWLDTTPTSRVVARCTQDIGAVDGVISGMVQWLTELTVSMIVKLGAIVIITPIFLGPGLSVALFGGWLCQVYMSSQLSVKREMSNAKAPVLAHFGATINGLVSIRAYRSENAFIQESLRRIDRHTRAARTFYNLNRWVTVRLDILGAVFTSALAAYMVYFQSQSASNTGFSLNMSIAFSGMILYWVMFLNDLEVQGNSLERIQQYLEIEQESQSVVERRPPAYWPASGELVVEHLSSKYSEDGPEVLHDLSFRVNSGEHIGIVGRTGSGKSSLTLSLLRAIFVSGTVYYDGLETKSINLDALRSSITIIPQVPEMLSGTLRQNLDPFDQYEDAQLNDALRASGLNSTSKEAGHYLTLDSVISSGGDNLSIGQRQILALARAIVRGSKLLILDEATSAIDHETDMLIQSTLRHKLGPDVTLLTVAHRLHTIMDADKIMVLDEGRIIEFDSPEALLHHENGSFKSLVDNSGDKDNLCSLVRRRCGV